MRKTPGPAVQDVIDWIYQRLNKSNSPQLPSVREIARQCHVATPTVSRAISLLRQEGIIDVIWGHGIYRAGESGHNTIKEQELGSVEIKLPKWRVTAKIFEEDILNGLFDSRYPLPQIKQLQSRYTVSYPTMKKILGFLEGKRIIIRICNRYFLRKKEWKPHRYKIALIAFGTDTNALKIETERERNFFQYLFVTASQNNIDIELICYNDYLDVPRFFTRNNESITTLLNREEFLGTILNTWHMKDFRHGIYLIANINKPITVWLETDSMQNSIIIKPSSFHHISAFDISYSLIAGRDVGKYLLQLGHRTVAYLSPFNKSIWSQNRLKGLNAIFKASGSDMHVMPFVLNEFENRWSFTKKIIKKQKRKIYLSSDKLRCYINPELVYRIDNIEDQIIHLLRDNLILDYSRILIEQALAMSEATAWVACNDLFALIIMDYWNQHCISKKKRPALIGFDNTFKALKYGLSSYDFNTKGMVQSMIDYILRPSNFLYTSRNKVIHLYGNVIERESTRL